MKSASRRVVVAYVVLALLATGAAVGRHVLRTTPTSNVRETGEAKRFLDLTGGSASPSAKESAAHEIDSDDGSEACAGPDARCMPNGWRLTPAGKQVNTQRFPLGLTATADQKQILVTSDSGGLQSLHVIDAESLSATITPAANLFMGVAVTPEGQVFASGGNANRVFRLRLAGSTLVHEDVTEAQPFPAHSPVDGIVGQATRQSPAPNLPVGDGIRVPGYPGGSLLDGNLLYVAGTLSEAGGTPNACPGGNTVCGRVSIIDTKAANGLGAVIARVPVGMDAFGLAIDPARKLLYVSNWADESGRGAGKGGTVSVVDVSDPTTAHEVGWATVGHHPSAVQLSADRTRLFVANTNDDSISVLDVTGAAPDVVTTESVKPVTGVPVGAHPDAFALSPDGERLFVALAGMNAVEVRDGHTGARLAKEAKYIPTGWYPSALLVTGTADDYRLWVTNAKGDGPGPGVNLSVGWNGDPPFGPRTNGTVSRIDLPVQDARLNSWTEQVHDNDRLDRAAVEACAKNNGVTVSEVLCPKNGKSPIKHVLYIVTENKTFDQYFGDVDPGTYDADPNWLLYGQPVTPNHHALVGRNSLSDRFFSDAEVSVTGHSFTSGAIATDHNEKVWQADYDQGIRGAHGGGDPLRPSVGADNDKAIADGERELDDPEGGYIFEAFKRAGAGAPTKAGADLTMAIYGESTARESGDMSAYQAKGKNKDGSTAYWKQGDIQYFDTCRAHMFITGKAEEGDSPWPDSPEQMQDCAGRTLDPQYTLKHWAEVYEQTGKDVMPNFMYMSLPVNHTLGTNLGSPTPASMVADNDYAIGLVVEALSKSPFWKDTVVMQTEDDTQAAGDHISPLRDYLQVIGPWARPGANHQWGSMGSLLRTIETIFDVAPISLNDKLALPQHGAFRTSLEDGPDTRPYAAIRPVIPFGINQLGAPGQAASMAMDWSTFDLIDEATLNAIQYAVARGTPLQLPDYAK